MSIRKRAQLITDVGSKRSISGFVSRVLSNTFQLENRLKLIGGDHLSLHDDCSSPPSRPTRVSITRRAATMMHPVWSSSGWGLPSRSSHPERWCALTAPFHPCHAARSDGDVAIRNHEPVRRSALCCTFPNLTAGRRYRPSCPSEPGLSSHALAVDCSTTPSP